MCSFVGRPAVVGPISVCVRVSARVVGPISVCVRGSARVVGPISVCVRGSARVVGPVSVCVRGSARGGGTYICMCYVHYSCRRIAIKRWKICRR